MVCTRTMSGWCRARSQRSKLIEKGESTVRWHQRLQAAAPVIVGGDDEVLELVEVRGVSLGPTSRTGGTEAWSSPRIGGGDGASPNSGEVEGSPAAGHGQDVTRGEMSSSLCSIQRWVVRRGGEG
jgi:hypothetical protein